MTQNTEKYSYCNICGYRTIFLMPRNSRCPVCNSLERHRHLYIHLLPLVPFLNGKRILHFAPEAIIKDIFVNSCVDVDYYDVDVTPGRASYVADIKGLPFSSDFFDYVIAIHVLEHIDDDRQAMKELYRTLKPGGTAIVCVPFLHHYHNQLYTRTDGSIMKHLHHYDPEKTFEIPGKRTPRECFELYGQEDHLRIYSMADFCKRLQDQGFTVRVAHPEAFSERLRQETKIKDEIVFATK